MKLIFAGTPEFAARSMRALLLARHDIALVLTQPDRPAGRGMSSHPSPVKELALEHGLPLAQPASLKPAPEQERLRAVSADAMVVAAYGLILPQPVLEATRRGAINIHASLLPRWRGAAPIQRALLAGDPETGISIMQMDAGLDTGPVLLERATPITDEDTAGSLHERLADLGARLIVEALAALQTGSLTARAQDESRACYAAKIRKSEARIDWHRDARTIHRQIRAFDPAPGCSTVMRGIELKVWKAELAPAPAARAAEVLESGPSGVLVGCAEGGLRLLELQRPGGRRLAAGEFVRGFPLAPGERFEA